MRPRWPVYTEVGNIDTFLPARRNGRFKQHLTCFKTQKPNADMHRAFVLSKIPISKHFIEDFEVLLCLIA
jgi:hypothetical protein